MIQAVAAIAVIRLLSPEQYGLYMIATLPASLASLFVAWGVPAALTRYIAKFRSDNNAGGVSSVLRAGLIFMNVTGLAAALIVFLLPSFFANLFHKPSMVDLVRITGIFVFGSALYSTSWSVFLGFEKMKYNGLAQLLFSVAKSLLSIMLVLLGLGAFGAVFGLSVGQFLAGFVATIVALALFKRLPKTRKKREGVSEVFHDLSNTIKMMLLYGIPLAVVAMAGRIGGLTYSFLMARYCSAVNIGNLGVASNFGVLIRFFTFPIAQVLFPAFSKITKPEEKGKLETAFKASVKFSSFFVVPATVLVMVLSRPLVFVIFGDTYSLAPFLLVITSIGSLYCGLGSLSMGSLLLSQGKTRTILKINLFALLFGAPLSFFMIMSWDIYGYVLSGLLTQTISVVLYAYWTRKLFRFSGWFRSSGRIYASSLLVGAILWLTQLAVRENKFMNAGWMSIITLIVYLFAAGVLYIAISPLFKSVNMEEIEILESIVKDLGLVGKLLALPIKAMKKLVRIYHRSIRYITK